MLLVPLDVRTCARRVEAVALARGASSLGVTGSPAVTEALVETAGADEVGRAGRHDRRATIIAHMSAGEKVSRRMEQGRRLRSYLAHSVTVNLHRTDEPRRELERRPLSP